MRARNDLALSVIAERGKANRVLVSHSGQGPSIGGVLVEKGFDLAVRPGQHTQVKYGVVVQIQRLARRVGDLGQ